MSEEKESLRKLIMLISELRAKDEERYEAHVNFMNETIKMVKAIESQMNKHWQTVLDSLKKLNEDINTNLDSLLTGINPQGLRETSKSLREIMDTMNRSLSTMNLEKIMSELQVLSGGGVMPRAAAASSQEVSVGQQPEEISPDLNAPGLKKPASSSQAQASGGQQQESEWVDPHEKAKKEQEEEEEPHLLKPSDFFK
ncbi:MAG: hypothetical protein GF311_09010 [Candidatus Lokiarchaeota archaeon]|jgi:hypothetical protein|nr:hypothetical protein [Candidatus Lokiarchaeota archaeon]